MPPVRTQGLERVSIDCVALDRATGIRIDSLKAAAGGLSAASRGPGYATDVSGEPSGMVSLNCVLERSRAFVLVTAAIRASISE
jgi:hypothetical protein